MNRGDLFLRAVQDILAHALNFKVVHIKRADAVLQPGEVEAYSWLVSDKLYTTIDGQGDHETEDGQLTTKIHFIEAHVSLRWQNVADESGLGLAVKFYTDIVDKVERAFAELDVTQYSQTHFTRTHKLTAINVVESLGYFNEGQEIGETVLILSGTLISA